MSKLNFPSKPAIAVDWDGTLVPERYPEQPREWLPGAEKALRKLTRRYKVYVWTSRIAPTVHKEWHKIRPDGEVEKEIAYIRDMLDSHGFKMVGIWTAPFKLPAEFYIDNKGVHFDGDWEAVIRHVWAGRHVDKNVPTASPIEA
jgi:hypothetical protein